MEEKRPVPLGGRIWFSAVFFGLIGQIAWIVENMYFATFAQDIFANSGRADLSYGVTTMMVILSAITATATTVFAGSLSDRTGKRKPFIAFGYIFWGLTIMLFAVLPMKAEPSRVGMIAALLVFFDCLMTFAGSTSNDAAFNAWVADVTDKTNRGSLNAVLAILPVIAVVIVFIGLGSLYSSANASNARFFLVLGAIPIIAGILALFILQDAPGLQKAEGQEYLKDTFYGFRRDVIRDNRMIYVCLSAACIVGIAQQTFFSYLINFLIVTLGLGDGFVIPMAVIIVGAAVFTAVMGILFDRKGRKHFYYPLLAVMILGILSFWLIQFTDGMLKTVILYVGGVLMMGGILSLTGAFTSSFQDYLPEGTEGRFQGVRMCFMVLIPMIVGPIISLLIGLDAMGMNGAGFVPPYTLFLAAAIVALPAVIPVWFVRKDSE
ncbi:MAG: MFS transporter [Solobacterium sp.]|nr:MFS transporter [Solobacterium sp.]MBQ2689022.1 MFS transporter [Solobacterium sp.]